MSLGAGAGDLAGVLKAVEQRYNSASTLEARFEQRYAAGGQARRSETGELRLRKPGRMRWQYEKPEGKVFVCDGKWIWFYSPAENRAERTLLKNADDYRAPLAFLLGRLDFRRDFGRFEFREEGGEATVAAFPKKDNLPYTRVEFTVTPQGAIRRLAVTGVDASVMEFLFTAERLNTPVADSEFKYTPPKGAEVVEAER